MEVKNDSSSTTDFRVSGGTDTRGGPQGSLEPGQKVRCNAPRGFFGVSFAVETREVAHATFFREPHQVVLRQDELGYRIEAQA